MMEIQEGAELCFPELLNASCRKPTAPQSQAVILQILLFLISVVTVVLNLLVIISVSHFRQLHVPSNLLLVSLAVSDFLVGLVLMPSEILLQISCWFLGDLLCSLYNFVTFIVTSASVGNMVLISIDRYFAICVPLHYQTRVTVERVTLCICVCWCGSVLYNGLILKKELSQPGRFNSCYGECVIVITFTAGAADLVVTFIAPIIVIVVLYLRVFVVAVSQARAMRLPVLAITHEQSVHVSVKKSEMKAAKTLGVVVLVFLISFFPYYCIGLTRENSVSGSAASFVLYLYYLNSCLNPLIYALFYPWFRKAIKLIVTRKFLQPDSCEANIL
ncbi:trace amine-associated receptor 13c-like [Thalassophryne amazonica]|uniref:trace amine-associated receptor 13c-like n=1 Tax=Thalassophryne amazonica TaxID=390379 RepID=UPI001470EA8A|nr:trace amine-associated receptor 13c-like [Thalassophryne amazonica]